MWPTQGTWRGEQAVVGEGFKTYPNSAEDWERAEGESLSHSQWWCGRQPGFWKTCTKLSVMHQERWGALFECDWPGGQISYHVGGCIPWHQRRFWNPDRVSSQISLHLFWTWDLPSLWLSCSGLILTSWRLEGEHRDPSGTSLEVTPWGLPCLLGQLVLQERRKRELVGRPTWEGGITGPLFNIPLCVGKGHSGCPPACHLCTFSICGSWERSFRAFTGPWLLARFQSFLTSPVASGVSPEWCLWPPSFPLPLPGLNSGLIISSLGQLQSVWSGPLVSPFCSIARDLYFLKKVSNTEQLVLQIALHVTA